MVEVIISSSNNANPEAINRAIKRQAQIEGIFKVSKRNNAYSKPSEAKKLKKAEARQRRIRNRRKPS